MKPELNPFQFESELYENILPFWMANAPDRENGGFVGGITNDLAIRNDIPRTAVSCTRFLWTFSHAFLATGEHDYLKISHRAYQYLTNTFWDQQYGGLFWSVDIHGQAVGTRKHSYAQAFGIYGLSEYFKATQRAESLELAHDLFELLESHAFDPSYGGYSEGRTQDWLPTSDMRLGKDDLNCHKSMNTMLHILEAYTNLVQISDNSEVKDQLINLIRIFQTRIIGPSGHFLLYFDQDWSPLSDHFSYGHDIEGSWLLAEAADVTGSHKLIRSVATSALHLAEAVLRDGIRADGAIIHEATPEKVINPNIEWWPQAEAVVGFYNAYQLTTKEEYRTAAENAWQFICTYLVDTQFGGWIKRLLPDRTIDNTSLKAGPWEGPYHESRMCFEMAKRLNYKNE